MNNALGHLKSHVQKFVSISDEDFLNSTSYFEEFTIKKKQTIHHGNSICKYNYFVASGCVRMFFINEKGNEQTTEFAIENWWITDLFSYINQQNSEFYIQAVEDSLILKISKTNEDLLCERIAVFNYYFKQIYQKTTAASQMRSKYLKQFTKEEFYLHFKQHFPEFLQRVPQYLLASYLGFTPEYLSEIRKKEIS